MKIKNDFTNEQLLDIVSKSHKTIEESSVLIEDFIRFFLGENFELILNHNKEKTIYQLYIKDITSKDKNANIISKEFSFDNKKEAVPEFIKIHKILVSLLEDLKTIFNTVTEKQ
jgi:coenzyme F420-reducing hydrogenase alpha subunit